MRADYSFKHNRKSYANDFGVEEAKAGRPGEAVTASYLLAC